MSDSWKPRPDAPHEPPPKARYVIHLHGREVPGARFQTPADAWAFVDRHAYGRQQVWDSVAHTYVDREGRSV